MALIGKASADFAKKINQKFFWTFFSTKAPIICYNIKG